MDVRLLRTFIAVAENRGFAHAAEALGYSQPTVSAHIAALEEDLRGSLFYRDRRPVELTPPGEALMIHARAILGEVEAARESMSDFLGVRRGSVRLGTYPSATAGYVPRLLHQFKERYPQINIQLVEGTSSSVEEAAVSGEITLFLRPTFPPVASALFDSHPLWREDFKVIMRTDHELAEQSGPLLPQILLQHELIITGRRVPESLLTHPFWRSLGERPNIIYEVIHPQSMIELVRARIGIGVLNQLALNVSRVDGLFARAIAHPAAVRDVSVYWLRSRALPAAARALLDFMIEEADVPDCAISTKQQKRG